MADTKTLAAQINTAFIGVQRRAEAVNRETLVQTFVDIGTLFAVLSSRDHQIVYGRRGTGKTHALLYAAEQSKKDGVIPIYTDLRSIGSSGGLYADQSIPLPQRATRLLLDVLGAIHEELLHYVVDTEMDLAAVGPALDDLAGAISEVEVVGETQRETRKVDGRESEEAASAAIGISSRPTIELSSKNQAKTSSELETRVAEIGSGRYRVHFGRVNSALTRLAAC